jgi:hypothetical protein
MMQVRSSESGADLGHLSRELAAISHLDISTRKDDSPFFSRIFSLRRQRFVNFPVQFSKKLGKQGESRRCMIGMDESCTMPGLARGWGWERGCTCTTVFPPLIFFPSCLSFKSCGDELSIWASGYSMVLSVRRVKKRVCIF